MARKMRSPELSLERHVVHCLRAYLRGNAIATEKWLDGVIRADGVEALERALNTKFYPDIATINPERLIYVKQKYNIDA